MLRKGWNGDLMCQMCNSDNEIREHLFYTCSCAQQLWKMCTSFFNVSQLPTSFDHFLLHWPSLFIRKELSPAWDVLSVAVCWLLWGERNLRCFQKKSRDFSLLFADAIFFVNFWRGPVAKKRKDTIMSAVEMVHFPSTWQADSSLLTQWDYEAGNEESAESYPTRRPPV